MNQLLKATFLFIIYVTIQSIILALFTSLVWNLTLLKQFSIYLGYFDWFGIIFIINLLRMDVVEKINNFNKMFEFGNKIKDKTKDDEIH